MTIEALEKILPEYFLFIRKLPKFESDSKSASYLVSPSNNNFITDFSEWKENGTLVVGHDTISINLDNSKIKLNIATKNPNFLYFQRYCFLGSILSSALKRNDKSFSIREKQFDYILEEKIGNQMVYFHNKITDNFKHIFILFELSQDRLIKGFSTSNEYFDYLFKSPHLQLSDFNCLLRFDSDYTKELYQYCASQLKARQAVPFTDDDYKKHLYLNINTVKLLSEKYFKEKRLFEERFNFKKLVPNIYVNDKSIGQKLGLFKRQLMKEENIFLLLDKTSDEQLKQRFEEFLQTNDFESAAG